MGPASNIDALILRQSVGSGEWLTIDLACTIHVCSSCSVIVTPRCSSNCFRVITSPILGTLRRITGSSVSRQAASIGSAAFLFPDGVSVPVNGTPPLITNCSISLCIQRVVLGHLGGKNRVVVYIIVHMT